MADYTLTRQRGVYASEDEKATARRVLFGFVDGIDNDSKRRWRGFLRRLLELEPGESVHITTSQARLGWFHRKHMAMEQAVFDAQDTFEAFRGFRDWLKVGAGLCTWMPGPHGVPMPLPDSIAYPRLEQGRMEAFHRDAVDFLRTDYAATTLWPHLPGAKALAMVESVLSEFEDGAGQAFGRVAFKAAAVPELA